MDSTYGKQADYRKLISNYKSIETFVKLRKRLSYIQFDYSVVNGLTLFMLEPDYSFEALESKIDAVLSALPSIKRIFAQPCIHLKERDVIVPVESVKRITKNTVQHIASHSELWSDITDDEIKPTKLLTKTYEDDYGIYENLVFCKTIDEILSFARSNIRFLKELIYANQTIEINLLERVNHLNYFLALGKLHIGYSKNFDSYYAVSQRCLNKLQFIMSSIMPRLKRPVYKNNRRLPQQIKLRKTNILAMHKEYHQIYKLAKSFAIDSVAANIAVTDKELQNFQKTYFNFCEALSVFAVGNFNFSCREEKTVDFSKLNITFTFKKWKLKLQKRICGGVNVISFEVTKDAPYTIVLIPCVDENRDLLLQTVKENFAADEYVVCAPFENSKSDVKYIDVSSIESFRRIQQFVLRAMVYSDRERTDCPFCSNNLSLDDEKSSAETRVYECFSCRTEITDAVCKQTDKPYSSTKIAMLNKAVDVSSDEWLNKRQKEAQMFFRNITDLDEDMEPICPSCGQVHNV